MAGRLVSWPPTSRCTVPEPDAAVALQDCQVTAVAVMPASPDVQVISRVAGR